jgi:hypothetical protein
MFIMGHGERQYLTPFQKKKKKKKKEKKKNWLCSHLPLFPFFLNFGSRTGPTTSLPFRCPPKRVGIMAPHYERTVETLEGRAP